jgi:multisubunit Na+/H+ antiporter MnhG subunit
MEIAAVILAVLAAFIVLKFISGMVKFVVLGVVVLALFYFMTGGFGA